MFPIPLSLLTVLHLSLYISLLHFPFLFLYSQHVSLIYLFSFDKVLVGSNRWLLGFSGGVSVVELNRWPALVVGFFRCLLGFSGGISVVDFSCGVESMAGFGGGFFSVFAGF